MAAPLIVAGLLARQGIATALKRYGPTIVKRVQNLYRNNTGRTLRRGSSVNRSNVSSTGRRNVNPRTNRGGAQSKNQGGGGGGGRSVSQSGQRSVEPGKQVAQSGPRAVRTQRQEKLVGSGTGKSTGGGGPKRITDQSPKPKPKSNLRRNIIGGAVIGSTVAPFLMGDGDEKKKTIGSTPQMKKDQQMVDDIARQAAAKAKRDKAAKDKRAADAKAKRDAAKDKKGSGSGTGSKTESKTFRERRLARMKRRLKDAENEGRKRRLKRRIGRVEGRIEDTKERRAARRKAGGGEMVKASIPGYKDGKEVKKQGANDRLDESLGMRRGKESTKSQSFKSRRNESRGATKKSRPQSAGVAKRGWGAAMR